MPAQLLSLTDGPSILLDKPILLVGRHDECDIQLNSRKVSRKHCCIAQISDHLIVRDLESTNGVRINGVRVKEGILRTGDELTIGNYRYQIHAEGEVEAPPEMPSQKPQPPNAATQSDDDNLESGDLPVPLKDSGGKAKPAMPYRVPEAPRPTESSLNPPAKPPRA